MKILYKIIILVFCHLIGDYVLSSDYIQSTKGENWYHLFIHSALYCLPFLFIYGINASLLMLFITHFLIDMGKSRYEIYGIFHDQCYHYMLLIALYF